MLHEGCAHVGLDELQKALEDFSQTITLDPENIESLRNWAILHRDLGKPDKAVQD